MLLTAAFAAFVGFTHSLSPGHWLPVVLMARKNRWHTRGVVGAALLASSGHILVSLILGSLGFLVDVQGWFTSHEQVEALEKYAGLAVAGLGILFAGYALTAHSHCHGHEHHGPGLKEAKKRGTFLFLMSVGIAPCGVVLPVFAAAAIEGPWVLAANMVSFSLGVIVALVGASVVGAFGLLKLDHPILEHYGEVITGLLVSVLGLLIYFRVFDSHH